MKVNEVTKWDFATVQIGTHVPTGKLAVAFTEEEGFSEKPWFNYKIVDFYSLEILDIYEIDGTRNPHVPEEVFIAGEE